MSKRYSTYSNIIFDYVTPAIAGAVVFANTVELLLIMLPKKRKITLGIIYILNLCISDIMVGLFMIILKSMNPFMRTTLKGNIFAKEAFSIMQHVFIRLSLFISVFNSIALTVDRVIAITKPFVHRQYGKMRAIKICVGVWALSLVCVITIYCVSRFSLNNVTRFNNVVFPFSCYIATTVFIICYLKIFIGMRNHNQAMRKHVSKSGDARGVENHLDDVHLEFNNPNEKSQPSIQKVKATNDEYRKRELKILALALKSVVAFVVCWFPYSTCNLIIAAGQKSCGGKDVQRTFFTIAFLNSLINPIIYFGHGKKAVSKVFKKLRGLSRSNHAGSGLSKSKATESNTMSQEDGPKDERSNSGSN